MWELFERRYEAEHYLSPLVTARQLIGRMVEAPVERSPEALRAELDGLKLTFFNLRAFYHRTIELTGGPTGQDAIPGDAGYWQSRRDRLLVLRAVSGAAVGEVLKARQDLLAVQDLAAAEECKPVDERAASAIRAAIAGRATEEDAERLATAARDYQDILGRAALSEGGFRLLRYNVALALDSLGRACESLHRDAEAEVHFGAAGAMYAEAGEPHLATESNSRRDAAGQRLLPDADTRLERLLAQLRTVPDRSIPEWSVDRAALLVGLAELAHGNNDDFEAGQWLREAKAVLAPCYDVPNADDDDTDAAVDGAVERWIQEIPRGDDEDPTYFLRRLAAVLTVHSRVAAVWLAVEPAIATTAAAQVHRLHAIPSEMQARAQAIDARLAAQLDQAPSSYDGSPDDTGAEQMAITRIVMELADLTGRSTAGTPAEVIAQWQRMAEDCIARARVLGQPLILAQALDAGGRVKVLAGEPDAALVLWEEEYEQASGVGGKLATDQMIIAMSNVAGVQFGLLSRVNEASEAAGKAIALIERDRYRVSAPFQQAALLAPHADVFAVGVFSAWKSGDYDTMLQRMELSKARASVRQFFLTGQRDSTEIDQELSALNSAIHGRDHGDRQSLRRERLQWWDRRAIARRDPEATVPPVTLAGVQALLEPDEAVLYYYWLMPEALLVVTITADAIAVEIKQVAQEQRSLLESMAGTLGLLTGSNLSLDSNFIAPLAPLLTPVEGQPLLDGKQRLIVSPHRLLHWYPFAAMPYRGEVLVRSVALRYVPNLTSLLVPSRVHTAPRMAALAVSEFPGRAQLDSLPGVPAEAADCAGIYAAAGIPSALLAEPTRAEVLGGLRDGTLGGAWCLSFSTHGHSLMDEVSENAPLESVLELADDSVDGYEIAAAGLGCAVVVLTACCTGQRAVSGRGRAEQPGDELFGMSAAFLQAGCGSVLAPAWPTDDAIISRLITAFHRNIIQGSPADVALAQAQRAFLDTATDTKRRAYYWASLVLTAICRPAPIPLT